MSTCHYYHCQQPKACEHYGWCIGHRAGLATWQCEHLLKPAISEPAISEPAISEPAISEPAISEPLLKADTLPYYLDKIEEYNEPQELIEQLAKSQTDYNIKIEAEMEEMRKKLAKYEENKKIVDEIHQLEEKVKSLQTPPTQQYELAKAAFAGEQKKRVVVVPTITTRPVGQKPALTKSHTSLTTQKK